MLYHPQFNNAGLAQESLNLFIIGTVTSSATCSAITKSNTTELNKYKKLRNYSENLKRRNRRG
jgi:hypothetical protein